MFKIGHHERNVRKRIGFGVADTDGVVALNFLKYTGGGPPLDVMVVSGTFGLKSYDESNAAVPILLDAIDETEFRLPSDPETYNRAFWENEDMDVDPDRKLVIMARDPRAFDGSTSSPSATAGVYIVDAADPANLDLKTFEELPVGHTSTCVNDCDFLWTGGPASNTEQAAMWPGGRPIFATDLRDLDDITTSPVAIDTERFDGVSAYAHDVQVDARDIAWVSGRGGVRGYHTSGRQWDPIEERYRVATATDPVPYAGGGIEESAAPSSFIHNSDRPVGKDSIPGVDGVDVESGRRGGNERHCPLLFGALLRSGQGDRRVLLVRPGHPVPRHLRSAQSDPDRLFPPGRRSEFCSVLLR